jgi:hypothetical protein
LLLKDETPFCAAGLAVMHCGLPGLCCDAFPWSNAFCSVFVMLPAQRVPFCNAFCP